MTVERAKEILEGVKQQLPGAGPCEDCLEADCGDCGGCKCVLSEAVAQVENAIKELGDGHT